MNPVIIAVLVLIFLVINFGRKTFTKSISSKLTDYLYNGDFDNFEKLINKWYTKYLIHPFNIDFLKLNEALMKQDSKEIDKCFETFEKTTISDNQKAAIYQKAFYYYLQEENNTKLKKYHKLIKGLEDKTLFNSIDDTYRVIVEKDETLLEKYEKKFAENNKDSMCAYILYNIYKNKGNKKKTSEYEEIFNELVSKGEYLNYEQTSEQQ